MAGRIPAITLSFSEPLGSSVDARNKSGHDRKKETA
jgi:hypothetical protein